MKKDSAAWRAIVTTIEGTAVFVAGLMAVPEVRDYIVQQKPELLPLFPVVLATVNFVRNYFRKDVPTI